MYQPQIIPKLSLQRSFRRYSTIQGHILWGHAQKFKKKPYFDCDEVGLFGCGILEAGHVSRSKHGLDSDISGWPSIDFHREFNTIPIVYKDLAFDDQKTICHLVGYIVTHRRPKGTSRIRATSLAGRALNNVLRRTRLITF